MAEIAFIFTNKHCVFTFEIHLFQIVFPLINFSWERKIVENSTKRISVQFVAQNYTCNKTKNTLTGKINITVSLAMT